MPEYQRREIIIPSPHSVYTAEKCMNYGIDALFDGRQFDGTVYTSERVSRFWTQDFVGPGAHAEFKCPASLRVVSAYTKKAYSYPYCVFPVKLPNLTVDGQMAWFGYEIGGGVGTGISDFWWRRVGGANIMHVQAGGIAVVGGGNITAALPADHLTAVHDYSVKVNRPNTEFYIDDKLIAITLNGANLDLMTYYPPYAIFGQGSYYSPITVPFIELAGLFSELIFEVRFDWLSIIDSEPLPPRQYDLYTEDTLTKWKGLATAGAVLTSHPVPVWGYPNKTLYFQADAAGVVDIQVYVGGAWRTAKSITLVANTLEIQVMDGETPLMRCVYTPTDADTITLAEVHLS